MAGATHNEFDPAENVSPDEEAEARNPAVGTGTPDDAPWEEVEQVGWLRRQPIVAMILAVVLVDAAALVTTLADASTAVTAALLGTLATVLGILGRFAWLHVTPTADPKLAPDLPLEVRRSDEG